MNIKDNRRVSMTKKIIKDTFIEMLEKKIFKRFMLENYVKLLILIEVHFINIMNHNMIY